MSRIAIHGFGRIGRSVLRAFLDEGLPHIPDILSDVKDWETLGALFECDTNYPHRKRGVLVKPGWLHTAGVAAELFDAAQGLPNWQELGVGLVIDCTGRATRREIANEHLDAGAQKVLVSAPPKTPADCDAVLLWGINTDSYNPEKHHIISMASCTTNALAPVVKVLHENFGIEAGFFSTIHAYTSSQSLTDQPMADRRDSWAAAENIIPASSGAAKALQLIWPNLAITGKAYRVPVRTVSIVELIAQLKSQASGEEINFLFQRAANEPPLVGILGAEKKEFPSSRFIGEPLSSVVDLTLTKVSNGNLVSTAAWYDNEYGYACRLAELACHLFAQLPN